MSRTLKFLILLTVVIYNLIGTLAVCSMYGGDLLYGEWVMPALIITFPVIVFSFAWRYVDPTILPAIIIQSLLLIGQIYIFWRLTRKKK